MRRSSVPLLVLGLGCAALIGACASGAHPAAPPASAAKVMKQRTIQVKVPVLVKESSYYADGLLDGYVTYRYDAANKNLLEKDSYDAARSDPVDRTVSEWSGGRLTDDMVYDQDGKPRLRHDYGYDAAGHLVSDTITDGKGQPSSSSTYAYDAAGNKTEWRAFDAKGVLKALTVYSYGKPAGSGGLPLMLIAMKDSAGTSTGSITLSYDDKGRLLRRDYRAADGSPQKSEVYAYGPAAGPAAGMPTALEIRRADGSLASRTLYVIGDLGQVLKATDQDGSGVVRGYKQFEYTVREDSVTETYYE